MIFFSYQTRQKQKEFFFKIGKFGVPISLILILVGFIFSDRLIVFASIGQTLLYMSVSSAIVFSRLGWSKNMLVDFLFNRMSIVLSVIGYGLAFLYVQFDYGESIMNTGILVIIFSFFLVWLGNKFQSPIQESAE